MLTKSLKTILIIPLALAAFFIFADAIYAEVNIALIDSGSQEKLDNMLSFTNLPANIDPIGHGTKIAKLVKSINPQANITMLQVCEKTNNGYTPSQESILKAIQWCEKNNIDIVNLSLVIEYNKKIENAIKDASNKGIIFIAAAGNKSIMDQFAVSKNGYIYLSKDKPSSFPANSPYVISVGAKDLNGKTSKYSATDADIFSQGDYNKAHGTSFACARVSAQASKIISSNSEVSLKQLKTMLK